MVRWPYSYHKEVQAVCFKYIFPLLPLVWRSLMGLTIKIILTLFLQVTYIIGEKSEVSDAVNHCVDRMSINLRNLRKHWQVWIQCGMIFTNYLYVKDFKLNKRGNKSIKALGQAYALWRGKCFKMVILQKGFICSTSLFSRYFANPGNPKQQLNVKLKIRRIMSHN